MTGNLKNIFSYGRGRSLTTFGMTEGLVKINGKERRFDFTNSLSPKVILRIAAPSLFHTKKLSFRIEPKPEAKQGQGEMRNLALYKLSCLDYF